MKTLINRKNYIDILLKHKDTDLIKIISGVRRSGKSTLLTLYSKKLTELGINSNHIISMNLEALEFSDLIDYKKFYEYIKSKIVDNEKYYLIFDEIQIVPSFEKALESLRINFDVDIYITGSNAFFLSSEFATLLSGRYVEIKMYPLSFSEFLDFHNMESMSIDEKFEQYLKYGGMPILCEYQNNEELIPQVLNDLYSTIIIKDILTRDKNVNVQILNKLSMFMFSNIGNILSPNKIANVLSNEKTIDNTQNIANKTIEKYIAYLNNAFIFYNIDRYDIKGKQHLKTLSKNYAIDIGIKNSLLGYRNINRGSTLENIVFLELLRRGYDVHIGKINDLEIDFVCNKMFDKKYIQVTESINDESTRHRELEPLKMIKDGYEKIILTMDKNMLADIEGVKIINIVEWLDNSF